MLVTCWWNEVQRMFVKKKKETSDAVNLSMNIEQETKRRCKKKSRKVPRGVAPRVALGGEAKQEQQSGGERNSWLRWN